MVWKMANILVVDDSASIRLLIKVLIRLAGHHIVGEAANGVEAIEQYRKLKPDLVTMDHSMPIMKGIDALKRIKEIDPNARVIMCSALGDFENIPAIEEGAKDFIAKPFQVARMIEAINKALT